MIPWFAVWFIVVAGFNSLGLLPQTVVCNINAIDTFLLTMAMSALGMETSIEKFKNDPRDDACAISRIFRCLASSKLTRYSEKAEK